MREWITLGLLCFGLPLYGQQATARIMGTVLDPSSATIAGAAVTVTSVATSQQRSTLTSSSGEYSIPFLPIGEYTVMVQAPGFQPKSLTGIVLQVDQEARFDVTLNLGSAADAITVQAESPLLVTDDSSVGQVIENKAIINMPLNGRAFWQLAQLTPGVVFTPGGSDITSGGQGIRATRIGLRISGSSRLAGGWLLDGFDITEYELGATSITPSTDAIEEFKVLAGGMSAEYALPSVINAALKSGTNSFHGSAYEFLRNEKLQARNFFAAAVPPLKRNQFGATFGGPIRKDKIFFFGDYEGGRTRQGTTTNSVVPTARSLDGDFTGGRPLFDPLTTAVSPTTPGQFTRTAFAGNVIPANRMAPQAAYFRPMFPVPNQARIVTSIRRHCPSIPISSTSRSRRESTKRTTSSAGIPSRTIRRPIRRHTRRSGTIRCRAALRMSA